MRITSEFWVAAYVRRRNAGGAFAAVLRRGASEAGAIFVKINRLDGTVDLYGPAPQVLIEEGDAAGRLFECLARATAERDIDERLARERSFDPDIWVVEVEDRTGEPGLEIVSGAE